MTTGIQNAMQAAQFLGLGDSAPTTVNPAETGQVPFAGFFQGMVAESNELDAKAEQAATGLLNGSGVEVHDVMIAAQKSSMAFELGLQMRNKAVAAYQQMMNMQF